MNGSGKSTHSQFQDIIKQLGLQSAKLTYDECTHTKFTDLNMEQELVLLLECVVDRVKTEFCSFAILPGPSFNEVDSICQGYTGKTISKHGLSTYDYGPVYAENSGRTRFRVMRGDKVVF